MENSKDIEQKQEILFKKDKEKGKREKVFQK